MPEKRILVMQAELVRKIDENRGDTTQAEFIELLIDSQLEWGAGAPHEKKYATKGEFRLFEEDIKQFLESFLGFFVSYGSDSEVSSEVRDDIPAEALEQSQIIDHSRPSKLEKKSLIFTKKQGTTDYEIAAELEILPPLDMHKMTKTMIYLESLPEVETVELVPLADKPLVIVILRRPTHLIEILKKLPEVSQAEEVTEGKLVRIQMKLSGSSVLDEVKEELDSKASSNP